MISIRGAREHNLKNVDLTIPRDKLVVFTGLSGSGKSSLAFDTIYAEGQRRYVESLSAYARQFLEMMQKPDVDQIDGLSPAISIEQKTTSKNPRSTVGTVTEIYDYMRLLWARVGIPYSPATGLPIESQTVSQMVDRVHGAARAHAALICSRPSCAAARANIARRSPIIMKRGFQRLKIDGQFYEIAEAPALDKKLKHDIEVVVDRLVVRPDMAARLAESFETALELADGIAIVEFADEKGSRKGAAKEIVFSSKFACPVSGFTISGDRAATVLLQQSFRRLPDLRRARHRADGRCRSRRARSQAHLAQGRDRALGALDLALLSADARRARPSITSSASIRRSRRCRRSRAGGHPLRLRRGGGALFL